VTQVVTKIWHLLGEVSKHDFETLRRAGVSVSILTDDYPIDTFEYHIRKPILVKQDVRITTKSNEQEAWLKLCFGDRLEHFSTCYDTI